MAKAAIAGKQTTVTMRNLAAKLSEDHELSKKQTEARKPRRRLLDLALGGP